MVNQLEVTMEIILHVTEDSTKIFEPIFDIFQLKEEEFTLEKIHGYYGNPILLAKITLTKKRAIEFVKILVSKIPKKQLEEVLDNFEMYFERSSMFLRIGKENLVNKMINLQQDNAIKIRIKVPIYKKDEAAKVYRELLKA